MGAAVRIGRVIKALGREVLIKVIFALWKQERNRAGRIAGRLQRSLDCLRGILFSRRISAVIRHAENRMICVQGNASSLYFQFRSILSQRISDRQEGKRRNTYDSVFLLPDWLISASPLPLKCLHTSVAPRRRSLSPQCRRWSSPRSAHSCPG